MRPRRSYQAPVLTSEEIATLQQLRERFASLPDERVPGRTMHRLDEVVLIALCAMLADQESFTDMESFARSQMEWLRTFLELKHGVPSHDVFRQVFMSLPSEALLELLCPVSQSLSGEHLAIDGKALRGTYDGAAGKCRVHILRAWVGAKGFSAAQVRCAEKSNELEALPRLLRALRLQGSTVSIDAMGTHPQIAGQIHEAGGHYVLCLKANQKNTLLAVQECFAPVQSIAEVESGEGAPLLPGPLPEGFVSHETVEHHHGRYEHRRYFLTEALEGYARSWKWPGLRSLIMVQRRTQRGGLQQGTVLETHYYLSSLPAEAARLAQIIRGHWSVENQCHWVLDVIYHEDHCQVRDAQAAHNLSLMRELTAKILKSYPDKSSLRAKRKLAALDPVFRSKTLASFASSHFDA